MQTPSTRSRDQHRVLRTQNLQDVSILVGQENISLGFACSEVFTRADVRRKRQKMIRQATQNGPENGWGVRNARLNSKSRLEVSLERELVMANIVP